ncbi:MAG: class I SAM-dependent methyltransferase, partial [bacterium]|nr:class I SAM-dependent methyltransferase [bacterium]
MSKKSTSWGHVASWYDELLSGSVSTYQKDVILPKLLRLLNVKKGEIVLDLACGQGFFSRALWHLGAKVIGVDIAKELIRLAEKQASPKALKSGEMAFHVSSAHDLHFLKSESVDAVVCILALQNIEDVRATFRECARVMKKGARFFCVLNHPAFRIPKTSSWGWEGNATQYRRIESYLSPFQSEIQMHPGEKPGEITMSFHRPMEWYTKELKKNGLCVTGMEEWVSNKISKPGLRAH